MRTSAARIALSKRRGSAQVDAPPEIGHDAMSVPASGFHLVVVGASAGGIEALSALVSALPSDLPAAVVIAQHLDPKRPSHLGEILARRSVLPVRTVVDREMLRAGVIYVVPSNRHVEITDHMVGLTAGATGSTPSVNLLFSSAASTFAEHLVAIVLSGTGSDGALGARIVHEAGGTVVIQNPETAAFPGMPRSLAPTTVDLVADLEDIGPLVHAIVTGTYVPEQADDDGELRELLQDVRERRGFDFSSYRRPTLRRRLQRRMVAAHADTIADYRRLLRDDAAEQERLVSTLLIKVTDFFRDPQVFTYLRERVLSGLIDDARARGEELRVWSAGCATGEEVYSVAMLILELLGDDPDRPAVRIFATDLDRDAVSFARRGVYPAKALANVPQELVTRYFAATDGECEVSQAVRDLIVFGDHDISQRPPFARTDLVLCRNVLMYFTPALQKRVLQAIAFSLRTDGALVLGSAETPAPASGLFVAEASRLRIHRRTSQRAPLSSGTLDYAAPQLPAPARLRPPPILTVESRPESSPHRHFEDLILRLSVGVVVVNRRYDIQIINGAARQLLGIHSLAVGEDLIHLLEGIEGAALRGAIDAAFRDEAPAALEEMATTAQGLGEVRHLHITCLPQPPSASQGATDSVLVTVIDVSAMVRKRQTVERAQEGQHEELQRLRELMERMSETNRKLLTANDELAFAEATLRTTNEEYLAAQAQAQVATEELETYGEELQATNEEMETLNEELKATIEELSLSNADLDARAQELTIQRAASEEGKAQLAAILASMGDAVVMVDAAGRPLRSNTAYDELLQSVEAPFVPRDEQGQPLPDEDAPEQRAARGETFSTIFRLTATDGSIRWFEANGQPMQSGGVQGGVVVIREITERTLRQLQEQFMAMAGHELRTPLTALLGYSQLLLKKSESETVSEPLLRFATVAVNQAARLKGLVDDLMSVSRLESGKLELNLAPVDLASLASRGVDTAQVVARGQTIHLDAVDGPLLVRGDAARLEDVLLNLLTNAIKYAPSTERIDVRLRLTEGEAQLSVEDYGPGIPSGDLPYIFSRFYQVTRPDRPSQSGLGLGLYIVHETVLAHGGSIEVRPGERAGVIFTVRLPLLADDAAPVMTQQGAT